MKKTIKKAFLYLSLFSVIVFFTNCYGSFELTRNLYEWNGKVTNDEIANSVITFAFVVIPVYPAALFVDYAILNTIEFWTGENPIAMTDDAEEIKWVDTREGKFCITASKYQYKIDKYESGKVIESVSLIYKDACWYLQSNDELHIVAKGDMESNEWVQLFYPNGESQKIALK